ncbi:MAG: chloride channel protein [Myxococcota bacterium]
MATTIQFLKHLRRFLLPYLGVRGPKKLYIYALMVGAFSGLAATAFTMALNAVDTLVLKASSPLATSTYSWGLFLVPAIGGLLSGLLTYLFAPEAGGHGTDAMIDAFHNQEGKIRARTPYVKILATLCTLGSGGSAGKEGPLAQVGAGFGSWWAEICGLGSRARRALLLAGAAGGLGAIFRSPLGGALTAIEVLYKEDFESDAFIPCVISSVTGYAVVSSFMGGEHIYQLKGGVAFHHPREIFFYALLALVCMPMAWMYVKFFYGMRQLVFDRLPVPSYVVPALGGVIVGIIGLWFPQVLGSGDRYLQEVISGGFSLAWQEAMRFFLTLAVLKIVATTCTVGAGGSGGVFAPSLFIGGMLGAMVGTLGHILFPEIVTAVEPYVLVGMGAFFAGIANAPLASLIMVSEMTGGYALLAPMMAVGVVTLLLNRRWSIYEKQVSNRFASPAHLWDMRPDILQSIKVGDGTLTYSQRAVVQNNMLLFSLEAHAQQIHATDFIVVDANNHYVGAVSLRHTVLSEPDPFLRNVVLLEDVATKAETVKPSDNLRDAMAALLRADMDKIAVEEGGTVLGHISNRDILRAYELAMRDPAANPA